jgi:hypothetical protein
MKRAFLAVMVMVLMTAASGCLHHNTCPSHSTCECGGCGGLLGEAVGHTLGGTVHQGIHENCGWRHQRPQVGPPGPPTGTYAYPYYTLRGPRDFLVDNPPGLGN